MEYKCILSYGTVILTEKQKDIRIQWEIKTTGAELYLPIVSKVLTVLQV